MSSPESFNKCSSYSSGNGSCFVFLCDSAMHIHKGSSLLMICISITRLQHTDLDRGKNGLRCLVITVQLIICCHQRLLIFCYGLSGAWSSKQAYLRYVATRNLGLQEAKVERMLDGNCLACSCKGKDPPAFSLFLSSFLKNSSIILGLSRALSVLVFL